MNIEKNQDIIPGYMAGDWPSGYYFWRWVRRQILQILPITRCGVGVHYVGPNTNPVFDAATPLPGQIQTNNRAEIYAILIAVRSIEITGLIHFHR